MKKKNRKFEKQLQQELADAKREIAALKAALAALMPQPKLPEQPQWWRGYPWECPWHCTTTWTYAT